MSGATTSANPAAAELSALLGLRCFGCGAADIIAVAPGLEDQATAGFTYQRGQDVRGWCAECWPWSRRQPIETMECVHAAG